MSKKIAIVFGALVLLVGVSALAYASIPASDGTINGCYQKSSGTLIVVDSSATCPKGYVALNWNQTGPAGPAGISGYQVVEQNVTLVNTQTGTGDFLSNPVGVQTRPVVVDCPAGKVPLSGGGKITTDVNGAQYADKPVMMLADSRPTATGWSLTWLYVGSSFPGSNGTEFIAHIAVTCGSA